MYRTDQENERLWYAAGFTEMAELYDERAQNEGLDEWLEKAYESPLEQSEFRRQLIKEIIALCDNGTTTRKELVRVIKSALENSYVEL